VSESASLKHYLTIKVLLEFKKADEHLKTVSVRKKYTFLDENKTRRAEKVRTAGQFTKTTKLKSELVKVSNALNVFMQFCYSGHITLTGGMYEK
jgi:hypothetical protein